ncbi:glycosyltransferase family 4 protein [Lachnoclostridium sp. An138]|uniref:glycosyltransferase family 4 protein n=1 Tax=Lachnoclostridium sp. An138 TaxID=1965560 RepID=UPI000B39484A|nr:glycosyltransferase family 4 protein [Lachnoclostridium sp. An138]OUQ19841.1 hypothetical protein B5E82_03185 [Lachnoclostridium sp. An138]
MDIIILADFCGSFEKKDNSRFLYLADLLCKEHKVEIVTSDFNHGMKEYFKVTPTDFPYKITMLHEGRYKKNVSLSRFKGHYIWGKQVAEYLKKRKRPDIVYCAVPTLKASYEAGLYCKKNKIRFIIDIQDLWPEAFQMVFNVPVMSKLLFAPFKYLADSIYSNADEIFAVSQTYVNRALKVNNKCRNGYSIFLGTELEIFDKNAKEVPIIKKREGELWLAYCGTLGKSYDIECVIKALALLKSRGIEVPRFVVMGEGSKARELRKLAKQNEVDVSFTGMLPYNKMCALLCQCDMVVNPISCGAAQSIINKHADYAASGLPVLNTQENVEYRKLVNVYKMGINCKNNDEYDLADKIEILLKDEHMRKEMGSNARKCAEEKFDRKKTYKKIIRIINEV